MNENADDNKGFFIHEGTNIKTETKKNSEVSKYDGHIVTCRGGGDRENKHFAYFKLKYLGNIIWDTTHCWTRVFSMVFKHKYHTLKLLKFF